MTDLQFRPFTPNFRQVFHCFEVDLRTLFEDFARAVKIWFCLAGRPTIFIEFSEVDV